MIAPIEKIFRISYKLFMLSSLLLLAKEITELQFNTHALPDSLPDATSVAVKQSDPYKLLKKL